MANTLDIIVIPTYNTKLLGITDASTYDGTPVSPNIEITVPGFGVASIPFIPNEYNVINSTSLGLTEVGYPTLPLPDGLYTLKYTITPAYENFVTKTIMRIDQLQEKFDEAFMRLDMMECDKYLKQQAKVELSSISFMIQCSMSAANNCAVDTANKLYVQASKQLANFMKGYCGCSGSNYVNNF